MVNRRYHTWSDYNNYFEEAKPLFKTLLFIALVRELPLRHFYARCFVVGASIYYANYQWWHYHSIPKKYMNDRDQRELDNLPMVKEITTKRITSKLFSPTVHECDYWLSHNSPVFYHHHIKHYRYLWRTKREVAWDGTYNMPILPFTSLNDRTEFVHNGLNEATEPKPSGAW